MPVGGLTLRLGGDNWSWLARCSEPLPPGTSEWLGLVSHSQRRDTVACWLCALRACAHMHAHVARVHMRACTTAARSVTFPDRNFNGPSAS